MRSLTIGILFVAAALAVGCHKDDDSVIDKFTNFFYDADYVVKVPASPFAPIPIDFITPDIATHSEETYTANKTRSDLVQHIALSQLELSVKSPEGGTLSFLKSVDIYAKAEGLQEVRVAYKDLVPENVGGTLSLDVTGVDLKDYFSKTTYQLRISVTTDQAVTQDYEVNAHAKFSIDAKLIGD